LCCSSTSSLNPILASSSSIVSSDGKRKLTQVIPHSHSQHFVFCILLFVIFTY
jgi:hypothetical protein